MATKRTRSASDADRGKKAKVDNKEISVLESYNLELLKSTYGWTDDDYIVGIDEAGRGPAIGPMVYCAFGVRLGDHASIEALGVKDSKVLTEKHRDAMFPTLTSPENSTSKYCYAVDVIEPSRISAAMSARDRTQSLNTVSHNSAIEMLRSVAEKVNAVAVYVDTVGPPDKYRDKIRKALPGIQVVVSSKADAKFAVVSAASIVAKVTRDQKVRDIASKLGTEVGSGYPSDPNTVRWLATALHPFFGFDEDIARSRWGTIEKLVQRHGVPMTFVSDPKAEEDAAAASGQRTLSSFAEVTDHPVFSSLLRLGCARDPTGGCKKRACPFDDDD
eukprot:PhM_4_TR11248/c0_g1_i1/m.15075/K10743/RNASEH2A; ribonuclease H2 subunit A